MIKDMNENRTKYQSPEIVITRFETKKSVMDMEAPTYEGEIITGNADAESETSIDDLEIFG